ncbi:MAG: DoxX family membrane protein [Methylococcaceae bacterium]
MNLAPYLEFMLKTQADCLTLQANKIPQLKLSNKEKPIGKKVVKIEFINKFINDFLDNSQKNELENYKAVHHNYSSSNQRFIVQVEKNIENYILKISPNKHSISPNKHSISQKKNISQQPDIGTALLRITLGVIILVSWYENVTSEFYTADGITNFFNWLFDAKKGNNSSLTFYKTGLDFLIPIAGIFTTFLLIIELSIGLGLLLGVFTRFFSLLSSFMFFNYFLAHFGGHEWIWLFVLLFMASLAVFFGHAGRKWGIDSQLHKQYGEPKHPFLW